MPVQYPLIIATLCQRLGLGTYAISLIAATLLGLKLNLANIALLSLIVYCAGLLASATHLGKPQKMMNALANTKSHLTQESLIAPFVCLFLFLQAIDGWFITLSPSILSIVQVLAVVFSAAFVWSTGLVYQLYARPAWKTKLVSINFFLSAITLGAVGTYFIAIYSNLDQLNELLYLVTLSVVLLIAGQLYYSKYVSKLGYGVAINVFDKELVVPYTCWIITGVITPILMLIAIFFAGSSMQLASTLLLSSILSLVFWRMFFFLASKIIKFFPQYESDMTTDY